MSGVVGSGDCGGTQTDSQIVRQTDRDRDRGVCVHVKGELVRREDPSNWLMQI